MWRCEGGIFQRQRWGGEAAAAFQPPPPAGIAVLRRPCLPPLPALLIHAGGLDRYYCTAPCPAMGLAWGMHQPSENRFTLVCIVRTTPAQQQHPLLAQRMPQQQSNVSQRGRAGAGQGRKACTQALLHYGSLHYTPLCWHQGIHVPSSQDTAKTRLAKEEAS